MTTTAPRTHLTTTALRAVARTAHRSAVILIAGVTVLSVTTGAANADSNTNAASAAANAPGASRRVDAQENNRAAKFWTPERMKNSQTPSLKIRGNGTPQAAPADQGSPVHVAPANPAAGAKNTAPDATTGAADASTVQALSTSGTVAATSTTSTTEGYWQGSNTANPNAQIGRLFYQQWDAASATWKNYNCSGTVVTSENKSVVWTAGHCVYQTYSNVWNRNYVFCPGYRNGTCPYGRWTPYSQSTTTQWQNSTCTIDNRCSQAEFQYDLGALKMNAINGYRIANWVGSHGIQFNGAIYQYRYLFGYPLNKTSGQYLYYCAGNNTYAYGNLRMAPCTAGGGASGGPWLSQINSSWLGVVHSVNSHGDDTYMGGPYQGTVAQNLYGRVRY